MAELIIMPKLGFNMSEGKLVKWYKSEGEKVVKGENLFSIETDKTNMDIEAIADGVVRKLFISEGETLAVTLPIAIVGEESENIDCLVADALAQLGKESAATETVDSAEAMPLVMEDTKVEMAKVDGLIKITPRARRIASEKGLNLTGVNIIGTGYKGGICENDILEYLADHRNSASPLAKAIAAAEGIDLSMVAGSGVNGKIMKKDIQIAPVQKIPETKVVVEEKTLNLSPDGKEISEVIPYAGIRKIIGDKLSESKFTSPHLYFTQKVDLERLLDIRRQVNESQEKKTSVTDFIAKAVIQALIKYPDVNASLVDGNIVKYKSVNLGIAVAAPGGLIVPNIKNSQKMSVVEISSISGELFEKARNGKLKTDEYTGGTFTISNLGMFGIENFTAIINPPEAAILSISSTKDEVIVINDGKGNKEMVIRPMMNICLSVDHRLIDGLLAAQFVTEIKKKLENPIGLLV